MEKRAGVFSATLADGMKRARRSWPGRGNSLDVGRGRSPAGFVTSGNAVDLRVRKGSSDEGADDKSRGNGRYGSDRLCASDWALPCPFYPRWQFIIKFSHYEVIRMLVRSVIIRLVTGSKTRRPMSRPRMDVAMAEPLRSTSGVLTTI